VCFAFADGAAAQQTDAPKARVEEVVATGSRIARDSEVRLYVA